MRDFLQSTWFAIVVFVFVMSGILYNFTESASDAGLDLWDVVKKFLLFVGAMLFLPLVIIFGRTKTRKD